MKTIKIIRGCTADDILVDGKSITDIDQNELLNYLLSKIPAEIKSGTMTIDSIIQLFQYDKFEKIGDTCEQCGDDVYETTYEI